VTPLFTLAQALRLDRDAAEGSALSDDARMESAARGMVASLCAEPALVSAMHASTVPAVGLCGRGNNGGDTLAVLRQLADSGLTGLVAVVGDSTSDVLERQRTAAQAAGVAIISPDDTGAAAIVDRAGIVLDGISGIGYRGPRRPALSTLTRLAELARCPIVAIDIPSGVGPLVSTDLDPEPPVGSELTLCVEPIKAELYFPGYRKFAGRISAVDGVFSRESACDAGAQLLDGADLERLLPRLDPDSHKGDRGALGVYAGAVGSTGAAVLCSRAGAAAGAGSVTLIARDELVGTLSGMLVSQMVRPVSDPGQRHFAALVAGPGWGIDELSRRLLDGLWEAEAPLVLDADALALLAARSASIRRHPLVIAPHPGEFVAVAAAALGLDAGDKAIRERIMRRTRFDTATIVQEIAVRLGAVVILKNSVTWIGDPTGALAVWDGRNPALATAGSGDVLAGLVGGLLARGADPFDAARAAVIVHGLAGIAAGTHGFFEAEALLAPAATLAYGRRLDGNT